MRTLHLYILGLFQLVGVVIIIIAFSYLLTQSVYAQAYGTGSFSGGNFNVGDASSSNSNSGGTSSNGTVSAPSCGVTPPANQPQSLYAAIPQDGTSISLYFTDASAPYDHYTVTYGLSSGNYTFGIDNAGGVGTRIVTINALIPNTTYYFKVRAGNGCATGPWSNEISNKTKGIITTNNLQIVSTSLTSEQEQPQQQNQTPSCQQNYTVQYGDTLYGIAAKLLGDGNKYTGIAKLNDSIFPSLQTSTSLRVGWQLHIPCEDIIQNTKILQGTQTGYNVDITVKDIHNNPVAGAKVTLHSIAVTTVTDKNGIAAFHNIDKGQHQVILTYNNYTGQETINLTGNVKKFDLTIKVQPNAFSFSPFAIVIIILLLFIISLLIISVIILIKKLKIRHSTELEDKTEKKRFFKHA